MSTFRELLKKYRTQWRTTETRFLTQEEVSLRLGYGTSTYGQWERGRGRPSARNDVVKLIEIFYEGQGIKNLLEANALLQASEFGDLQEGEIRRIVPSWLPQNGLDDAVPPTNQPDETAPHRDAYERFPTEIFRHHLQTGQEIRILNTWSPYLKEFFTLLRAALQRQARTRILLLSPDSQVAELRNEALEASKDPVEIDDPVRHGVKGNLADLKRIWSVLDEQQRKKLEVRLYDSLPSISIHQVDQFCLMGIYFHGKFAINSPQFEVDMTSSLGEQVDKEFELLWGVAQSIQNIDDW
jgi:hypothetical protein